MAKQTSADTLGARQDLLRRARAAEEQGGVAGLRRAVRLYVQVGRAAEREGDLAGARGAWADAGSCYWQLGRLARALASFRTAHRLALRLGDGSAAARAHHNAGAVLRAQSRYEQALRLQREVVDAAASLHDWDLAARACREIGACLRQLADYPGARRALGWGLDLARRAGQRPREAECLLELAAVERLTGNLNAAVDAVEAARAAVGDADTLLLVLADFFEGTVRQVIGDHQGAIPLLRRARDNAERIGSVRNASNAAIRLARSLAALDAYDEAETVLTRTLAAAQLDPNGNANALLERGIARRRLGRISQARADLAAARDAYHRQDEEYGVLRAVLENLRCDAAENVPGWALRPLLHRLVARCEAAGTLLSADVLVEAGLRALDDGDTPGALEDLLAALDRYERGRRELAASHDRNAFYEERHFVVIEAACAADAQRRPTLVARLLEYARAESIAHLLAEPGVLDAAGFREQVNAALAADREAEFAAGQQDPVLAEEARKAAAAAWIDLSRTAGDHAVKALLGTDRGRDGPGDAPPAPDRWLPALAQPGVATLLLDVIDETVVAAHWDAESGWSSRTVTLDHQDMALLGALRSGDITVSWSAGTAAWRSLAAGLLPPSIRRGAPTVGPLLVVPSAELWSVSFAALPAPDQPLSAGTPVTLTPSLSVAAAIRARARSVARPALAPEAQVVALLDPSLHGTAVERLALDDHAVIVESVDALPEALSGRPGILLVSAHGVRAQGLARALDLRSGGLLRAGTLLQLALPPLVILAGCWTSEPDRDRPRDGFDMATCCLLGGANHVVVGDGPVDDEYTGRTIARMLPLLRAGTDPPTALAIAQRSLLRGHPTLTPAEWAGLRVVGA